MKPILRSLWLIINYKTIIVTTLSVVSTYVCYRLGLVAKFPDMLVGVAIVFPVVFSIGSAYTRRETALQRMADFRGHAVALFFATRDWTTNKENDLPHRTKNLVHEMMLLMKDMFKIKDRLEWLKYEKKIQGNNFCVTAVFLFFHFPYRCLGLEISEFS